MNRDLKDRLLLPLLIPLGALLVVGAAVVGFSRVLLSVEERTAVGVALVVALGILGTASWVTSRRVGRGRVPAFVGAVVGLALLAGGLALAGSGRGGPGEEAAGTAAPTAATASPGGGASCPAGSLLAVASPGAAVNGFDRTALAAGAGEAVVVCFENRDLGVPHNFAVYREEGGEQLGATPIEVGPVTQVLQLSALSPGSYFFRCDVHPQTMTGTLTVG